MSEEEKKSIKDKVSEAIQSGEVKMRPKSDFLIKGVLMLLGAVVVLFILMYLVSFIIFALQRTGLWIVASFGFKGFVTFVLALPWLLLLIALLLFIILELFLKRYSFNYRRPLLYSIIFIFLIIAAGSFVVAGSSFHQSLSKKAVEEELPFFGPFYRGFAVERFRDIYQGEITAINEDSFLLKDLNGEIFTVLANGSLANLQIGDKVTVFGKRDDMTIHALGIKKILFYLEQEMYMHKIPPALIPPGL